MKQPKGAGDVTGPHPSEVRPRPWRLTAAVLSAALVGALGCQRADSGGDDVDALGPWVAYTSAEHLNDRGESWIRARVREAQEAVPGEWARTRDEWVRSIDEWASMSPQPWSDGYGCDSLERTALRFGLDENGRPPPDPHFDDLQWMVPEWSVAPHAPAPPEGRLGAWVLADAVLSDGGSQARTRPLALFELARAGHRWICPHALGQLASPGASAVDVKASLAAGRELRCPDAGAAVAAFVKRRAGAPPTSPVTTFVDAVWTLYHLKGEAAEPTLQGLLPDLRRRMEAAPETRDSACSHCSPLVREQVRFLAVRGALTWIELDRRLGD